MPSDYSDPGRRTMPEVLLKRFEQPDEVREMAQGRFEIIVGAACCTVEAAK